MLNFFKGSRDRSELIYLYQVLYGSDISSRLFLTDAEQPVEFEGNRYAVAAIEHDEISASGSLDKAQIEVRTPADGPLARLFMGYPPERTVTLRILEGDQNDPSLTFVPIWSGRILNFSRENIEGKFSCEPIGTAVRRPGLRRNYQYACPHVLYGPQCRADKLARTVTPRVATIAGSVLQFNPGWNGPFNPVKFQRGMAEWTTPTGEQVVRSILQVSGTDFGSLVLSGPPTDLSHGGVVALSVGCNHQTDDCRELHQNINNYGGQPWIPVKNPIGGHNSFY